MAVAVVSVSHYHLSASIIPVNAFFHLQIILIVTCTSTVVFHFVVILCNVFDFLLQYHFKIVFICKFYSFFFFCS